MRTGFLRGFFFLLMIFSFWSAWNNFAYSQKKPGKDDSLAKLLKDIDNLYKDTDGTLTFRLFMTAEGWNSLNTLTVPQDPALYPVPFSAFGAMDPWYYFTIEYRFKPLRFITVILLANIMPETQNKVYSHTAYTYGEGQGTPLFKNSYQDLQGEVSVDIGPGDMTLSARFTHRVDSMKQVLSMLNGHQTTDRATTFRGLGWPIEGYNLWDQEAKDDFQEWRLHRLVVSLRNQKQLTIEPSVSVTGQYLDVVMPASTNLNYDPWTFNGTGDNGYGRTMPSYLVNKLTLSLDAKITFRPIPNILTAILGATITPTFPVEYAVYMSADAPPVPYLNIVETTTSYLNLDFRITPRILWQNGFTLTYRKSSYAYPYTTLRYNDNFESPGWMGRHEAAKRDIWSAQYWTGFQYK